MRIARFRNFVIAGATALICASCTVTEPVVVVGQGGEIYRGMTTAALSGGSFGITNGKVTCSGSYSDYDLSPTLTIPATCTDGRTAVITATREASGVSGMSTIAVSDGSTWTFGFGSDAARVEKEAYSAAPQMPRASSPPPEPATPSTVVAASQDIGPRSIRMKSDGGTYVVPVTINDAIKLDFVVDSGSADVSVPADVVLTLIRTGTINDSDFLGNRTYQLADGSSLPSPIFRIRSLRVGSVRVSNVTASVAPVRATLLLGQSFFGRFRSWSVDNDNHSLMLQGPASQR
jgi:predicted aspartyl protease